MFWIGVSGTTLSLLVRAFSASSVYLAYIPFLLLSVGSGMKIAMNSYKMKQIMSYCSLFDQMKSLLENKAEFVKKNNVCIMAYEDFSDVTSRAKLFYEGLKGVDEQSFNGRGSICDFLKLRSVEELSPVLEEYTDEEGKNTFSFYKEIFKRISFSKSEEEMKGIQKDLRGAASCFESEINQSEEERYDDHLCKSSQPRINELYEG